MDLVSSTLSRYLKHRFNGNGEVNKTPASTNDNPPTNPTVLPMAQSDPNEMTKGSPPQVYNVNVGNILPCCVCIREDLQYVAAGFENSHIYLWTLKPKKKKKTKTKDDSTVSSAEASVVVLSNNTEHNHEPQVSSMNGVATPNSMEQDQQMATTSETTSTTDEHSANNDQSLPVETMSKLLAHSGPVYSVVFVNTTNDLMLSCSEDTTIRLWCLNAKCNLIVFRGHDYPIWSLAVSNQGQYFASASMDATARLWRLDKTYPVRIFCGHDEDVECVQFHPNEKYIATGSSDSTVRLWSVHDGKMVRLMVGHSNPVISLSFLPNGKFLATASSDGSIKVWNLSTSCVSSDLSVPPSQTISFSPGQMFVSSCGADNIMYLWQVDDEKLIEKRRFDFNRTVQPMLNKTKLIQSQFLRDNKLFVVLNQTTNQKQLQKDEQQSSSVEKE